MHPHIFVKDTTNGSATVQCDCAEKCSLEKIEIELAAAEGKKLGSHPAGKVRLLYKNDSSAIAKWSRKVSKYYPICGITRPLSIFDHPIASPPPPYTPRPRRHTDSSDNIDKLRNGELSKQKSGMDLLIDAVTMLPDHTTHGAVNDSMDISRIARQEHDLTSIEYGDKFTNLLMLAEEAVKRIKSTKSMAT